MPELFANASSHLIETVRHAARPLTGAAEDYDPLLDLVGDTQFVLLGEASHGTHEFYRARADITKRLIREKGFTAVAAEADWPDAYRVNCYVRGAGSDQTANEALGDFGRFPAWMWRNADVLDFVGWLRAHNDQLARPEHRVGARCCPRSCPHAAHGLALRTTAAISSMLSSTTPRVLKWGDRVGCHRRRRPRWV
jgi:erythromycin esterase-like protein